MLMTFSKYVDRKRSRGLSPKITLRFSTPLFCPEASLAKAAGQAAVEAWPKRTVDLVFQLDILLGDLVTNI